MATLAFDSLQFARRLKAVGVPDKQAEVQAELMAEAFGFYADNIVTRDYLDATLRASFAEQDSRWDKKLAERDARWDEKLAERDTRWERQLTERDARWEKSLSDLDTRWEKNLAERDTRLDKNLAERDAHWDKSLAERDARLDKSLAERDARWEKNFAEHGNRLDSLEQRVTQLDARLATGLTNLTAQFRLLTLMIGGTWLLVGLPLLQDVLGRL